MPYSKKQALMKFHSGWAEVERVPALVLVDAHDPVAEVVVLADDVGVRVVQLVVRVLPLLGRRRVVPLPGGGVDLRVAHPVPLAVQDVVADLHVLQDLRHGQAGGADQPRGREDRDQQHAPAGQLEPALRRDDPADVGGVVLAAAGDHLRRGSRRARGRGPRSVRGQVGGGVGGWRSRRFLPVRCRRGRQPRTRRSG